MNSLYLSMGVLFCRKCRLVSWLSRETGLSTWIPQWSSTLHSSSFFSDIVLPAHKTTTTRRWWLEGEMLSLFIMLKCSPYRRGTRCAPLETAQSKRTRGNQTCRYNAHATYTQWHQPQWPAKHRKGNDHLEKMTEQEINGSQNIWCYCTTSFLVST